MRAYPLNKNGGEEIMNNKTTKDPVCGMELKVGEAKAKTECNGTTYYFCHTNCKTEFMKNTTKYTNNTNKSCNSTNR
jgi:Cu+-exporting ATPase